MILRQRASQDGGSWASHLTALTVGPVSARQGARCSDYPKYQWQNHTKAAGQNHSILYLRMPSHADNAPGLSTSASPIQLHMSCWQGSSPTVLEKCCGSFTFDAGLSFVLSCVTEAP